MSTVLVAVGNQLRRDDGAAHRVLDLVGELEGVRVLRLFQLAPEVAEQIASAPRVVFIDADIQPGEVRLEPVQAVQAQAAPLGHSMQPAEVVALSRALYGFGGRAFLCRVPGVDFSHGEGLSPLAEANAHRAARLLRRWR